VGAELDIAEFGRSDALTAGGIATGLRWRQNDIGCKVDIVWVDDGDVSDST